MGQFLCFICRKKWLHFDIVDTVTWYLLALFSIFREQICFKCFQEIEKWKSKVTDEQETKTQIKAVCCQVPSERSLEEGAPASESQEGRHACADPWGNCQLQRRRHHSRGEAQGRRKWLGWWNATLRTTLVAEAHKAKCIGLVIGCMVRIWLSYSVPFLFFL